MNLNNLLGIREEKAIEGLFWSIVKVLISFLLVGINGIFVAAEFAMVKVRKTRLAELAENGSRKAQTTLDVASQLDAYPSACQFGITLASLGLGWLVQNPVNMCSYPDRHLERE